MKQSFAGFESPTTPFFRAESGPLGEFELSLSRKYVGPKTYTRVIAAREAPAAYVTTLSVLSGILREMHWGRLSGESSGFVSGGVAAEPLALFTIQLRVGRGMWSTAAEGSLVDQ